MRVLFTIINVFLIILKPVFTFGQPVSPKLDIG